MGNKERRKKPKNKELDFLQNEIIRSQFNTYTLDDHQVDVIINTVKKILKQHFSNCKLFISGYNITKCKSNFVTEQMYRNFNTAVRNSAYIDKKIIDKALSLSPSTKFYSLDKLVRTTITDDILKKCKISPQLRATLRYDFINDKSEHKETQKIADMIIDSMPYDKIMEIIKNGEEYNYIISYMENTLTERRESRKIILREMPQKPMDAYPLARELERHFILHIGPTNSGKTYNAIQSYKEAFRGVYLAPLRLLAFEIFEKLNMENIPCDMLTGEEELTIPNARHISSTVEMANLNTYYDVAVIDECQMISDWQRGGAWTEAIMGLYAREIHLCASPDAETILIELIKLCGDSYEIQRHERFVPLEPDNEKFIYPSSIRSRDALIVFSRISVLRHAEQLRRLGIKASVIYGSLPYDVRRNEINRFIREETDVIVSTDAIGMGLNLPVRRIVFLETIKFDGIKKRFLTQTELKQIAGRAGRKGLYELGLYNSTNNMNRITQCINTSSKSLKRAVLRFPENILTIDMPLSKILTQWAAIPDNAPFSKSQISETLSLTKRLESFTDNKELIYKFVTIPFNTSNSRLYSFWFGLFKKTLKNEIVTPSILDYTENMHLEDLELLYHKSDILYHYFRHFEKKDNMSEILSLKDWTSKQIMSSLIEGINISTNTNSRL